MPTISIDNQHIEVPAGTKVIDAAERLGIMIPRFCYLKVLGAVGACRMCAVKFLAGPVKGINMSCMVDVADGMVVSTTDEEVQDFRRHIIEWLMMNHPHDCPVCDEGGHCLLQDETVSGGHGGRHYLGRKRTYRDQYLGPLVQHEMNRCIQCYRCTRFYQEYAGYHDLGTMGIASRVFFGRFEEGTLQSPFSGNLIDICPTGVYTDKPSRYKARRWNMERAPSICLHCALGCNTTGNARYRAMIRLEARENPKVNGSFICDLGRYGFSYANHEDRPRHARADNNPVSTPDAIRLAAGRINQISRTAGHTGVAVLGSPRSSLETQVLLGHICHHLQWRQPHFFANPVHEHISQTVVRRLDGRINASLPDIELADTIVAVGIDPLNEAPMLALAMRQAFRKNAKILVVDPRPVELPFSCQHVPVGVDELHIALALLGKNAISRVGTADLSPAEKKYYRSLPPESLLPASLTRKLKDFAAYLAASRRPVIICGGHIVPATLPQLAADLAFLLRGADIHAHLFYNLPGANAFGAALLSPAGRSFLATLQAVEDGEIKALLIVENDPLYHFPDPQRLERALGKLDLLLVIDYLPSAIGRAAHIMLPAATIFESGGSMINNCGRLQYAARVHGGGTPIDQISKGSHPPRIFSGEPPGRDFMSTYQLLLELGQALEVPALTPGASPWSLLPEDFPDQTELQQRQYPANGMDLLPPVSDEPDHPEHAGPWRSDRAGDQELRVVAAETLFGTEELSRYAAVIRQMAGQPQAFMHMDDGKKIGVADNGRIRLHLPAEDIDLSVKLLGNMAHGHLIVPRSHALFRAAEMEQLTLKITDFDLIGQ